MAGNSNIEWTRGDDGSKGKTWNPLAGCTRASKGCDFCYAASMSLRLEAMAQAKIDAGQDPGGAGKYIGVADKNRRGVAVFNGRINLDHSALEQPLRWKKPVRIFVNSMSDLFHHSVPDEFILKVFEVMDKAPQHTYQVLTKRPGRALEFYLKHFPDGTGPHIWIGTSVEDQEAADDRLPTLRQIKAYVRFLSCEPLLGPVGINLTGIHQVIVGGESGPNARPMHPDWARSLRDQCQEAGVAYFFKQHGEWAEFTPDESRNWNTDKFTWITKRGDISVLGKDRVCMYRYGKKEAGRQLDGREWNEFPNVLNTQKHDPEGNLLWSVEHGK